MIGFLYGTGTFAALGGLSFLAISLFRRNHPDNPLMRMGSALTVLLGASLVAATWVGATFG